MATKTKSVPRCEKCRKATPKKMLIKRYTGKTYCGKCQSKFPELSSCVHCFKTFPIGDLEKDEDGQMFCEAHIPTKQRKVVEDDAFGWYVLAVEPGTEGRVKKDILRKLRIGGHKHLMKRIIIARKFEEAVVRKRGELVGEGIGDNPKHAADLAKMAIQKLGGREDMGDDEVTEVQSLRYTVFRSRNAEGLERNDFTYQIRTVSPDKERKTIQVKKYPGYLICQMEFTADLKRAVASVRGAWEFLLRPVVVGHLIEVKFSKRKGGFVYKVRTPDKKTVVASGGPFVDKAKAQTVAETARDRVEAFKPTPMKTKEAAEVLLAQQTVNAIAKDPEELNKAIYNFRVGSKVKVVHGPFTGAESIVTKIDREDKVNVKVWIEIPILGHPIPQEVEYWHLSTISY